VPLWSYYHDVIMKNPELPSTALLCLPSMEQKFYVNGTWVSHCRITFLPSTHTTYCEE
jgi:hypothetical protein